MKTSPARRVYQILRRAQERSIKAPTTSIHIWARVFDIGFEGATVPPDAEDAVIRLLADLRAEINAVERGPHSNEILGLVQPIVTAARNATASNQLHSDWNSVREKHLRPETIAGWGWAAIHFPADDDAVTDEALRELEARIAELEAAASGDDVPADLRRFIKKQAQTLRAALRRYPVSGLEPLQDALSQSLGDAWRDQQEVADAVKSAPTPSAGVVKKMQEVYRTAVQICGDADKLKKGYTLMLEAYRKMTPVIDYLKDAVS